MNALKISKLSLLKQLAALKTGVLDGGSLLLYTNDFTPTPETVIGAFSEATFTGYTPGGVVIATFDAPYIDQDGDGAIIGGLVQFQPASPFTVGETVYGWYFLDTDGAYAFGGRFLNAPVPMGIAGNYVQVVPGETFIQN